MAPAKGPSWEKVDELEAQSLSVRRDDRGGTAGLSRGWWKLRLACLVLVLPLFTYYVVQVGKEGCSHRHGRDSNVEVGVDEWIRDLVAAARTSQHASPLPGPEFEKLFL